MRFAPLFLKNSTKAEAPLAAIAFNLAVAILLFSGFLTYAFSRLQYSWNWPGVWKYREMLARGWGVTLLISLAALAVSLLIGVLSALAQRSRFFLPGIAARLYVEVIRGTPLLVQLLIFFYVIADAFHIQNRFLVGCLTLAFFHGAYIGEIVRSGIESIGRSQWESGHAVGFTSWQTYRYVIFPQAFRQMLPALAGELASLIKDSSLLSVIGIGEFTLNAREVNSHTYSAFECFLPLALGYLIITLPLSLCSQWLERRNKYET